MVTDITTPGCQTQLFDFEKHYVTPSKSLPSSFQIKVEPKHDMAKSQSCVKELAKYLRKVNYSFTRFLDISLAAIEGKEEDYMKLINGLEKDELHDYTKALGVLMGFFMEGYYDDILGMYYPSYEGKLGNGYFSTPFHISCCMAEISDIKPTDTLNDPCCGSGSFLLAAKFVIHKKYGWKESCYYISKMTAIDIGATQVKMCKLQLLLSNYLYMISRAYDVVMKAKSLVK